MKLDFDLDDLTTNALKRLVKQMLVAKDGDEKKILSQLEKKAGGEKKERNDLADLDEEQHGKPNTPMVMDDDLPYDGDDELPDVPKQKKGKKNG